MISSLQEGEGGTSLNGEMVPLVQVLTPVRVDRDVVLHGLVTEEEMLIPPSAGGRCTSEDQLSYLSLRASQLYRFVQSQDFIEDCSRGYCHQVGRGGLDIFVRETEFSRGDKVQRKREGRSGSLGTSLVKSE